MFQITSIVAQTLPTLASALAYTILILFYAQVTLTASGRPRVFDAIEAFVARGSYAVYALLVGLNCVIPVITGEILTYTLWGLLSIVYLGLFVGMTYFGIRMMIILRSSMTGVLGCRLMGMSTVCCIAFLLRSITYGGEVYAGISKVDMLLPPLPFWDGEFGRKVVGYLALEWLPNLFVLVLMRGRKNGNGESSEPSSSDANASASASASANAVVQMEGGMQQMQGQLAPLRVDQQQQQYLYQQVQGGQGQSQGLGQFQFQQQDGKRERGEGIVGGGINRSYSANGGVAIPFANGRPSVMQPNQPRMNLSGGVVNANSSTMRRSTSGGRPEVVSLLGDRSQSAQASMTTPSYGAVNA